MDPERIVAPCRPSPDQDTHFLFYVVLLLILVVPLVPLIFMVRPAHAEGGSSTDLNGSDPRPFYIVGHNPNTVHDAEVALQAGANALEPDVTVAEPDTANRHHRAVPVEDRTVFR